jgi:cupin 2 domain-containing protein
MAVERDACVEYLFEPSQSATERTFRDAVTNAVFHARVHRVQGNATPAGEWYDQARDEWVILLKGSAGLRIEGEPEVITLKPGDYVHLPAQLKHRVEWTTPAEETVWLALHY